MNAPDNEEQHLYFNVQFAKSRTDPETNMRPRRAATAVALLLGATACASAMTLAPTQSVPIVRVTERQNKTTVTLRRRQQLQVVLHSTYWQFQKTSNPAVLHLQRPPKIRPNPSCVPGGGCGTVTATYLAAAPGPTLVTAERSSCGEASGCTAVTGRFTLHVIVRR
jgi:hypothetical protein